MYRFYLQDVEVKQPLNFAGLSFKKTRSERFGGFLYDNYGFVDGLKDLTFEEPLAVDMIRMELEALGIMANILFRVECGDNTPIDGGKNPPNPRIVEPPQIGRANLLLFEGTLDLATLVWMDCCKVKVSLTDATSAGMIDARSGVSYALDTTRVVQLHAKHLTSNATHIISLGKIFVRSGRVAAVVDHSVPFEVSVAGDLPTVLSVTNITAKQAVFRNDGVPQVIVVNGLLVWKCLGSSNFSYELVVSVEQGGGVVYTDIVGIYTAGSTEKEEKAVISLTTTVPSGASVYVRMVSVGSMVMSTRFMYDVSSLLAIEKDEAVQSSTAGGLFVVEAFKGLTTKMTDAKVSFRSDFFDKGCGSGDFFTSGENIRNIAKPVNVSLDELFDGLNKIYCLEAGLNDGVFWIERRQNDSKKAMLLGEVIRYERKVDVDRIYGSVKAGYSKWQAESKWKDDEFNSDRDYATAITVSKNELNLLSGLVTGGYMIEETRRVQFDEAKKNQEYKNDLELFLIATRTDASGNVVAEANENYPNMTNIIDAASVYNVRYSPARMVWNWRDELRYSGKVSFTSGTGNIAYSSKGKDCILEELAENQDFDFGTDIPYVSTFVSYLSIEDLNSLDEWVHYEVCGKMRTGLIQEVSWMVENIGKVKVNFTVKEW